jgi:hypothetical protein
MNGVLVLLLSVEKWLLSVEVSEGFVQGQELFGA